MLTTVKSVSVQSFGTFGEQHDHEGRIDQILSRSEMGIHPAARECDQKTREFGGSGKDTDEHELSRFPQRLLIH